jgi:hypothetical protein
VCGGGWIQVKGIGGLIWYKYYVTTYKNGKMRPVETIPGMAGWSVKGE